MGQRYNSFLQQRRIVVKNRVNNAQIPHNFSSETIGNRFIKFQGASFFMKWFTRVTNQFRDQPKFEKAVVRLEKLEKWVDLQFKSVLDPVQRQVQTNFQLLGELTQELDAASLTLSQSIVSEAKVHIHQLTLDHRKLFINSMHTITNAVKSSPTDTIGIKDIYEGLPSTLNSCAEIMTRSQNSLFALLPNQTQRCSELIEKIRINVRQANDIFEDSDYQMYLSIQRGIYNIHHKLEEASRIRDVIAKRKENIKALELESNRFKLKIRDIEHDPRYRHEKVAMHSAQTRYRNSFYALDLQDLYSKFDLIEQKIAANRTDLEQKEQSIKSLNIDAEKHLVFAKIKKRLGIEVELTE